jgi:hypothetical protein
MSVNHKLNVEEGILKNEPLDNCYSVIEPENMNIFPYFLLSSLKCSFNNEWSEGVGLLIGEDLIMTSAHNLLYKTSDDNFIFPDEIQVSLLLNGCYKLCQEFSCSNYYVPEKFKDLKKQELLCENKNEWILINEELVKNDYSIIFLPKDVGTQIGKIFNTKNYTKIFNPETKFFKFFEKHVQLYENLINPKNERNFLTDYKISLVSFTNYKSEYLNTPFFKYNSSFNILNKKYFLNKKILETGYDEKVSKKFAWDIKNTSSHDFNLNSLDKTPLSKMKTLSTLNLEERTYEEKTKNELSWEDCQINFQDREKIKISSGNNLQNKNNPQLSSKKNFMYPRLEINIPEKHKYFLFKNHKSKSLIFNTSSVKYNHQEENIKSDNPVELPKFFDENSLVICEAKGRLCSLKKFNNNKLSNDDKNLKCKEDSVSSLNENLTYFLTTYVGQSGSPIFLRIKKKYIYKNCLSHDFEYILIGFHSRCHVKYDECLNSITNLTGDVSDEQFINKISNKSCSENSNLSKNHFSLNNINKSIINTQEIGCIKEDYLSIYSSIKNSFIGCTSFSDYNIGFKLNSQSFDMIKKIISQKRRDMDFLVTMKSESNKILNSFRNFTYFYIDCFFYNDLLFQGFFHRHTNLKTIFLIVEKRLDLEMTFLRMNINERNNLINCSENFTLQNVFIQKARDQDMYYRENIYPNLFDICLNQSENYSQNMISNDDYFSSDFLINKIKILIQCDTLKLSEELSNKVINKIKDYDENYLSKLAQKNKKTIIQTIKTIFEEINFLYSKSTLLHGILYSEIKQRIIKV